MDKNGNLIYAVDFDGTLSFGKFPGVGEPNDALFRFLVAEKERGARLILYTCRTGADLDLAVSYCLEHGLIFEYINENLPEMVELYGGDTRKINADIYFDDKAINPIAGHFTVVPAGFNHITGNSFKKTMGTRIAELMRIAGLNQKELAEKVGTTETSISRYIHDKRVPNAVTVARMAKVLHTTADNIINGGNNNF